MFSDRSTRVAFGMVLLVGFASLAVWATTVVDNGSVLAISATATPTKTPAFGLVGNNATGTALVMAALPTLTPTASPEFTYPTSKPPTPTLVSVPANTILHRLRDIARMYGLYPKGDYIIVDQDRQKMFVVDAGVLLRSMDVTTGDPEQGWETPAWFGLVGEYWGTFQGAGGVMADDGWWLFQRSGNFLIHGLPYTLGAEGEKIYVGMEDLGAAPASHGCIRLSPQDASWFRSWQPQGRPIIILPFASSQVEP